MITETFDSSEGLKTLSPTGTVPESRMDSAEDSARRIQVLMNAEKQGRSQRRALVKGLVDGNPPYRPADLRKAGRAQACNVNWRVAEFYLNMARFAFYDVWSEVPTCATIQTDFGTPIQRQEWSNIITEEFDVLLRGDTSRDRVNQFSILDMVLYGCGPQVFCDETDWRTEFIPCAGLIVPDFASSDPNKWEEGCIVRSYLPPELYLFIRNKSVASEKGWNVETTRKAIMQAHTKWGEGGKYQSWEWHQQQLKNNSFYYGSMCKTIQCVHYYFREFPEPGQEAGRISHCIVINPEDNQSVMKDYLFQHVGRFADWNQIVHPMYYDNDGGGYHHSVTGLGVKMYAAMEYQNRLICNVADKAFAPKILFRPLTANNDQQLSIVQFAEFGKLPAGFDVVQMPVQAHMEEGIAFNRELTGLIASNLAQYRTALTEKSGNPITAYEAQLRAAEQSKLGRTQLNHYYNQLDWLFAEQYRRASSDKLNGFMPGGRAAVAFRKACLDRGVPQQAIHKALSVRATRTVGQGSPFMRQQALQQLLSISGMFTNEGGRVNLMQDYIASVAGQAMVDRYSPKEETPQAVDQLALASLQISAAKDGVAPIVGGSQNSYIFARAFLQAGVQSLESVKQGGNPVQVVSFLGVLGPALMKHIVAVQKNPTRAQEAKEMMKQAMQLEGAAQKLAAQIEQQQKAQQKQQQQMQQRQQQVATNEQLDRIELENKLRMQQEKTDAMIRLKEQKQNQSLAIADVSTASKITRENAVAAADQARKNAATETTE